MSIQVWLISWISFDYKENGRKKAFLQIQCNNIVYPNMEDIIVVCNHKRNGDYYENLSLSHFIDEL